MRVGWQRWCAPQLPIANCAGVIWLDGLTIASLPAVTVLCLTQVLESILRADKAVVYWLKNGCMHMDSEGPEIVRPCPAMNICSWVPNLFADAPSLVRDGVDSLCPKDPKFLPTIPQEFRNLLSNADSTAKDTSATDGPVDPTTQGL